MLFWTPTRRPPSAGRVRARAAADELRVAEAPRHAARASGGRPGERAPRGRRRKERAALGWCGRFPEEFGARGQREEGGRGSGPDLGEPPRRKPGRPVPSRPAGVGARRDGWVTWCCAWSVRAPTSRGRIFVLVCLL